MNDGRQTTNPLLATLLKNGQLSFALPGNNVELIQVAQATVSWRQKLSPYKRDDVYFLINTI
jgi:hypothetical protein